MLEFKPTISTRTNNAFTGVLKYRDNKWYIIINKKEYEVDEASTKKVIGYKIFYSLPSNDKYEPWTRHKLTAILGSGNEEVISKVWSRFKPGMKVKGVILANGKVKI